MYEPPTTQPPEELVELYGPPMLGYPQPPLKPVPHREPRMTAADVEEIDRYARSALVGIIRGPITYSYLTDSGEMELRKIVRDAFDIGEAMHKERLARFGR